MSYFDDASLVMIPSGYKDQKVYSVKPIDGSGDLTFSRASSATRVNSSLLVEKVRENLLTYSQDFSTAGWSKDATMTETFSQTDPNGGSTAVLLTGGTSGNAYYSRAITCVANVPNTFSIYIKGNASGSVSIRIDDSTTGPQYDINYTTSWQRFSVTRTPNQTGCTFVVGGFGTWINGENLSFAFVQLETGDIATDYIATTSSAVSVGPVSGLPRLDYSGGASCPSLLLEPQRTNLVTYSEQMSNAAWTVDNTTVSANAITSPDGYTNADKVVENTANAVHAILSNAFSVTLGVTYTLSCYVKAGERTTVTIASGSGRLNITTTYNLSTGTVTSSSASNSTITSVGNGWYRVTATGTVVSATGVIQPIFYLNTTSSYVGDGTSGAYFWAFQFEEGAYATSYIPTLSTAVTRVADFMYRASLGSAVFGTTDGVVFLETGTCHNNNDTSATKDFISVEKDGSNWFAIGSGGTDSAPTIRFATRIAGVVTTEAEPLGLSNSKIAIKYSASNFKIFVNGSLEATIAKSIGNYQDVYFMVNSADDLSMPLKQFLVFPSVLTDAECITLTA